MRLSVAHTGAMGNMGSACERVCAGRACDVLSGSGACFTACISVEAMGSPGANGRVGRARLCVRWVTEGARYSPSQD